MGIYGHKFDKLIEANKEMNNKIIIEMEVDHDFIEFILEEQQILKEEMQADVYLKDNKSEAKILLRDKVTVCSDNSCSHVNSISFKIIEPKKIIDKTGKIDVIVPGYSKDKTAEELKPYIDKAVLKKYFKKGYPDSIKLALDFAEKEQKLIRLIYQNPNTENQKKLFTQLIKDSEYVIDFDIADKEVDKRMHDKLDDILVQRDNKK